MMRAQLPIACRMVRSSRGRLAMMIAAVACGVALAGTMRVGMLVAQSDAMSAGMGASTAVPAGLAMLTLLCFVAVFSITLDFLAAMFEERAARMGTLRVLGLRTGALWRAIVGEGALVGLAGAAVGVAVSLAFSRLLLAAKPGGAVGRALAATESPAMLVAGAFGLATAVVAAVCAVWLATRVPVADLKRGRGGAHAPPAPRVRMLRFGIPPTLPAPALLLGARGTSRTVFAVGLSLAAVFWCCVTAEHLRASDHGHRVVLAALHLLVVTMLPIPVLGIVDAVLARAFECRHDLRTARALGARRTQLVRTLGIELLLVASLGLALAITLGAGLAAIRPPLDNPPHAATLGFGPTQERGG